MQIPIPTDISLEGLLELLETVEDDSDYRTREELASQFGVSNYKVYQLLHAARDQGLLLAKKVPRPTITGVMFPRWAYKFARKVQPKKKGDHERED